MKARSPLYLQVIAIAREHLGPAGERFMRRQIKMHLNTTPEELKKEDIPELLEWSKLAFAMLTDNQEYVHAFSEDLSELAGKSKRSKDHARNN
jgi:hypothetical protein